MKILIININGNCIGIVENYNVFNLGGKKVSEVKPKTTFKEIIEILLYNKVVN